jgi:DNA-binding response OmpR family regulator
LAIHSIAEEYRPDLAIIDLGDRDQRAEGLALSRRFRSVSEAPLILLAGPAVEDRMAAFDVGADDVLSRPFSVTELFARARVLLRRCGYADRSVLTMGDVMLDERAHTVARGEMPIQLTAIEFSLLAALMRNRGQVLSKVQVLDDVWGFEHYDVNVVEVHVSALRKKLEAWGPRVIHTVRGAGYVLRPAGPQMRLEGVAGR